MSRDGYPTIQDLDAAMEKNQGWMGPTFRLPAAQPYVMQQEAVNAAVLAERERCAKLVDASNVYHEEDWDFVVGQIRSGVAA
jgi:hypothetical protein